MGLRASCTLFKSRTWSVPLQGVAASARSCCGCTANMRNVPFFPSFRSDGVGALHTGGLQQALLPGAAAGIKIQEECRDTGHSGHGSVTDTQPSLGVPPTPLLSHRGGSQLGAGSASQIPSRAGKCFLMFNLRFTPCSTWTGAAVASQPVLSPHTRGVPAPLLLQLAGGWSLASLTPPQGGLLPGDQLFHPIGHRGSRGWTCRTGITLGGLLGVGNPFPRGLSPPRAGSAASAPKPLMQHQSHTVTLPGFSGFPWDQSHGYLAA